jgi:tRNA dimethylallyltransferase
MSLTRKSQIPISKSQTNPNFQIPNKINNPKRIIFIVGPTGVGKSETAVALAKRLKGEIISLDSMQVYKGMDILASKPSRLLRKKVRHHLMDNVLPVKEYNVSRYRKEAIKKIKDIIRRGKVPVLAGGAGLYMSILIDGVFDFKSKSNAIRKRLFEQAASRGRPFLYKRLQKIDPAAAARIHPHDTKRLIRALEVFDSTGKTISELQKQRKGLSAEYDINVFCLNRKRQGLYNRIDKRVDKMFSAGLLQEVKRLLKSRLSQTARFAIGIRELKGYFEGLYSLDEAKRLIKRNTRQYAKRQLTWFRKDKRIEWIEVRDKEKSSSVANRIINGRLR